MRMGGKRSAPERPTLPSGRFGNDGNRIGSERLESPMSTMRRLGSSAICLMIPVFLLLSCGNQGQPDGKAVARINGYAITAADFRRELAEHTYFNDIAAVSLDDKRRVLDERIMRELFIQAAVRDELHKDEAFRQAIEKYWEQILVTMLLKKQADQLSRDILVTREEVLAKCPAAAEQADQATVDERCAGVAEQLREAKKSEALEYWMEQLKRQATVEINQQGLEELR
ncbi:MAG: hypothetical protein AUK55_01280 [Syntrophobacteraceae bacterium CG2_30_61_12]|nr:MAG: hypothetical protein AUK55_01280 [Syntrophobacteraceae bacterium CG2_30_61_12]